jgi:putative inorganic carbon (HCO3(-)) transporter
MGSHARGAADENAASARDASPARPPGLPPMTFALYILLVALTYLRPVEVFAPELQVYRPMLALSLLTFAAAAIGGIRGRTGLRRQHIVLLLGFLAAIAASHVANGWAGGAVQSLGEFSFSALLFLATILSVTDERRLRVAAATVAFCTFVLALASIASYHTGFMVDKLVLRQNEATEMDDESSYEAPPEGVVPAQDTSTAYFWRVRSVGLLSDPNDFGQAIVVAIPLLLALYAARSNARRLLVSGVLLVPLIYTIYLTRSRGTLLGLATLLFLGIRRKWGTIKTVATAVLGLAVAMTLNFTGGRAYTANEESAGGRIDAWNEGLIMLKTHPLFGVGYNKFTDYHTFTAHNSFVLCFSELGLVGYFFWLGMIVLIVRELRGAVQTADGAARRWLGTLQSSLAGFLTCAFFLSRAYAPLLYLTLGLCAATAYIYRPGAAIATPAAPATRWTARSALLVLGSIVVIYLIVRIKTATLGRSV